MKITNKVLNLRRPGLARLIVAVPGRSAVLLALIPLLLGTIGVGVDATQAVREAPQEAQHVSEFVREEPHTIRIQPPVVASTLGR